MLHEHDDEGILVLLVLRVYFDFFAPVFFKLDGGAMVILYMLSYFRLSETVGLENYGGNYTVGTIHPHL